MTRHETDREDLLREATALVQRAELQIAGEPEPVTVGFRRDGSLSVFFGAERVYQFNSAGELRRAFVDGLLYKAERGRLVELHRERTEREVALVRRELTDSQQTAFLSAGHVRLAHLRTSLDNGEVQILGQVPADGDVPRRVRVRLCQLQSPLSIAAVPNVR